MESGHDIARRQIAGHGADRYPTAPLQALKLVEEMGELAGEILRHEAADVLADGCEPIRREYGDVGLALYALGDKLGISLIDCMREVAESDQRDFRRPEPLDSSWHRLRDDRTPGAPPR